MLVIMLAHSLLVLCLSQGFVNWQGNTVDAVELVNSRPKNSQSQILRSREDFAFVGPLVEGSQKNDNISEHDSSVTTYGRDSMTGDANLSSETLEFADSFRSLGLELTSSRLRKLSQLTDTTNLKALEDLLKALQHEDGEGNEQFADTSKGGEDRSEHGIARQSQQTDVIIGRANVGAQYGRSLKSAKSSKGPKSAKSSKGPKSAKSSKGPKSAKAGTFAGAQAGRYKADSKSSKGKKSGGSKRIKSSRGVFGFYFSLQLFVFRILLMIKF